MQSPARVSASPRATQFGAGGDARRRRAEPRLAEQVEPGDRGRRGASSTPSPASEAMPRRAPILIARRPGAALGHAAAVERHRRCESGGRLSPPRHRLGREPGRDAADLLGVELSSRSGAMQSGSWASRLPLRQAPSWALR
jgi:hypothetical protein